MPPRQSDSINPNPGLLISQCSYYYNGILIFQWDNWDIWDDWDLK